MEGFQFDKAFVSMMEEHDVKDVVILGHINPDGDAAGSVLGIAHYIHAVYPEYTAFPYLSEKLDRGPKYLVAFDPYYDIFKRPAPERYAVIVCDTATEQRIIGKHLYAGAVASLVIDHHAANSGYGDVNYTKISNACAENICFLLDWEKWENGARPETEVHPNAADYVYLGLVHDTNGFNRADRSSFEAAMKLIDLGADHAYVMKTMHQDTLEDVHKRSALLNMTKRLFDGEVAYVYVDAQTRDELAIGYDDIHPISGFLRDCRDVELAFTMYEEENCLWRCSFRSDGRWIDVNELIKPLGGGGHSGAAGLLVRDADGKELFEMIVARIETVLSEKDLSL